MLRTWTYWGGWLTAIGLVTGAQLGCESGQSRTPVRSAWPSNPMTFRPAQPEQWPATAPPQAADFMGNHPAYDLVPFENRALGNLRRHTFSNRGLDFDPDLDTSAEEMAFASTRNALRPDIYVKHVDSTAVTQMTSDPADDIQPRFSPTGDQIAFCSNRSGNWDVWLVNRDGTNLRQLTQYPGDEIAPCWSPDGKQIAFSLWSPRARRWEIWTLSVEQPGVRRFLTYGMFPAWSPDGERLAFQRARQRGTRWFSIWTVDLVDGEARQPTEVAHEDRAACIAPRWSPDGRMLVYCAVHDMPVAVDPERPTTTAPSTQSDLWAISLTDGIRTKLTDGGSPAFNPAWSTQNRVFFVARRGETENIWSLAPGSVQATKPANQEPMSSLDTTELQAGK